MGLTVANIGLGRLHIVPGRRLDSITVYVNSGFIQTNRSVLSKKFLDHMLEFAVVAFTKVVIANSSLSIDEILRRPIFVVERLPDPVVAVDGNRISDIQIAYSVLDIASFFFE